MTDNPNSGVKPEEIPPVTPTGTETPGTEPEITPSDQTLKPETETPEGTTTVTPGSEVGKPQSRFASRIGELIRENKSLRSQLEGTEEKPEGEGTPISTVPQPIAQPTDTNTPELQRARDFLKTLGYVPREEVQATVKSEIESLEARMILDQERNRLEGAFNGEDGRPKYDHDKVLEHARKTGIYNPEAAYENLYKAELLDWAIKNAQAAGSTTFTEKPSTTTATESGELTREALARILATPEGRKWYEENRPKVLSALQKGEL